MRPYTTAYKIYGLLLPPRHTIADLGIVGHEQRIIIYTYVPGPYNG